MAFALSGAREVGGPDVQQRGGGCFCLVCLRVAVCLCCFLYSFPFCGGFVFEMLLFGGMFKSRLLCLLLGFSLELFIWGCFFDNVAVFYMMNQFVHCVFLCVCVFVSLFFPLIQVK